MSKQLQSELSQKGRSLSSPSPERLRAWRLFFERGLALLDVLVHLEETPQGLPMNELAERILYSKSGFTRVVDRMEDAGLVRRTRPEDDRRTILIVLTDEGIAMLKDARRHHRDGIQRHFSAHLTDADVKALTRALEKISTHARPLRPGRIRG